MEHYLGVAREQGFSEEEIGAVQSIVMAVSAGRINAQMREVDLRIKERHEVLKRQEKRTKTEEVKSTT